MERRIWNLWVAVCGSTVLLHIVFGWLFADERHDAKEMLATSHVIQQGVQGSIALLDERLQAIESQLKADWSLLEKIPDHVEQVRRDLQRYAMIAKPDIEYRVQVADQLAEVQHELRELKIDVVNLRKREEKLHEGK